MATDCPFGWWLCDPKNTVSILGILMCLIEMGVMTFHGIRYFRYRRHIVLRKRYTNITIFVYKLQMLKQLSWICLLTNNLLVHNNITIISSWIHDLVWRAIRIPVTYLFYYLCMACWISRFWLCHYQIHCTKGIEMNQWQCIINADVDTNWYLKHKNTLGTFRFIVLVSFVAVITVTSALTFICYSGMQSHSGSIWFILATALDIVTCSASFCILYGIYRNIPVRDDNFFINEELKRLLYVVSLLIIPSWLLGLVVGILLPSEEADSDYLSMRIEESSNTVYVIATCYEMVCQLAQVAGVLVSTCWIYRKVIPIMKSTIGVSKKKEWMHSFDSTVISRPYRCSINTRSKVMSSIRKNSRSAQSESSVSIVANSFSQLVLPSNNYRQSDTTTNTTHCVIREDLQISLSESLISYVDLVQNALCFNEFVYYLSSDLLINNMMAFIEMIQFQQYIHQYITYHPSVYDIGSPRKLRMPLYKGVMFPAQIPQSLIVFGGKSGSKAKESLKKAMRMPLQEFLQNGKDKAYRLYEKYVMNGSDYEIDVFEETKSALHQWIESEAEWMGNRLVDIDELLDLFEDTVQECFLLLCDCYQRFVKTEEYEMILNQETNVNMKR